MSDRIINLGRRGLRGESYADVLRRLGLFGVLPGDSDEVAIGKVNADAAASAALAEALTGPTYASQAAGEAATTNGQMFAVNNGDGTVTIYLRTGGGSTAQRTLATTAALALATGSGMVGFDPTLTYAGGSIGDWVKNNAARRSNFALTPADFQHLVPGGVMGVNDTAAFVALAYEYFTNGRAIHFPDLGYQYVVDANVAEFKPPLTYNNTNRRPPSITADRSAVIIARTSGTWLVKLGTLASDYLGFLRNAEYTLPVMHDGGKTFTKAVLYVPFFLDCRFNYRIVCTKATRGAWYGDTTAPASSAGIKGERDYEWDFHDYARQITSITNAVNPVVTFTGGHGLWPSSGNRVVAINFGGTLGGWANINGRGLDCTILSATQIQLLNVDTSGYGALPGTSYAYLNFPSSRVTKQITGVTNANPAVIGTNVAHLLTTGDLTDVAEIFGMPALVGQFPATVIGGAGSTSFSIPVDTRQFYANTAAGIAATASGTYFAVRGALYLNTAGSAVFQHTLPWFLTDWGTWSSFGPGWAMQWVPHLDCDIAEYCDDATDVDDTNLYSRHFRIHQAHNPAKCGWDGKKNGGHFYNFPEAGEQLCAYYIGGDNNCVQIQSDGPFRYVFWAFGPRNSSTQCSTNVYIAAKDCYGALVRTSGGGAWSSHGDRLKSNSGASRLFSEHVGPGDFICRDTLTANVAAPQFEFGSGNRAASVRATGAGAVVTTFQVASIVKLGTGQYAINFTRPVPYECIMLVGGGSANVVVDEDESYGGRNLFTRKITCHVNNVLTDPAHFNATWVYP